MVAVLPGTNGRASAGCGFDMRLEARRNRNKNRKKLDQPTNRGGLSRENISPSPPIGGLFVLQTSLMNLASSPFSLTRCLLFVSVRIVSCTNQPNGLYVGISLSGAPAVLQRAEQAPEEYRYRTGLTHKIQGWRNRLTVIVEIPVRAVKRQRSIAKGPFPITNTECDPGQTSG